MSFPMSISTGSAILLDTVAAIALLNENAEIQWMVDQASDVYLPIIAISELFYGAENPQRVNDNIERVNTILERYEILFCDLNTAHEYGKMVTLLRHKGRKIPQNDMWITAIARQNNLTLVTRDAHFNEVDGLMTLTW